MIQKEIQTKLSNKIQICVWGKTETKALEKIPREDLTDAIRKLVSEKIGVSIDKVFLLEQVHGDGYYNTLDLSTQQRIEGDALYTTRLGEILVVKTADCMPIFFWSEAERLIGVIHSGWKGTDLGITEKIFAYLHSQGHSLEAILAYLGPCIRKKNYEVGEEVFEAFKNYSPISIESKGNYKYLLGLDLVLQNKLIENKIPIKFENSEICTFEDLEYHSHRRGDSGRNLNLIWMT